MDLGTIITIIITIIGWAVMFGICKNKMYYGHEKNFRSFEEFSVAIAEYIDYYNNKRIQVKTKWMPPVKYREASIRSG